MAENDNTPIEPAVSAPAAVPAADPDGTAEAQFIVGIGSSAGGLEALRELVANLPEDSSAAYVIAQHMSPQHKSLLSSLIASETTLTVVELVENVVPSPNRIYVTRPRCDVVYRAGMLRLQEPSVELGTPKPSVDRLLISLAENKKSKSMAIILSGTGSDGAYGVRAIRETGGITIAQDQATAKYDGMPNSAIETGCVDLVASPGRIGRHLNRLLLNPKELDDLKETAKDENPMTDLLQVLLARTRVDFREYKQSTVQRRIERRMMALGIEGQDEYTVFCRNNPREVDALFKDLLISVTRFFRDSEQFESIDASIVQLVKDQLNRPLRIWVAGCATGEEAYSICILLAEALGGPQMLRKENIQLFATDIDRAALQTARRGQYGLAALDDVPREFVDKYFQMHGDGMRVIDALRSVVLFSDHNLCQDPPFLDVDLICCRNLLIYFGAPLQSRVLTRLHYALNADGLLFVGTAESIFGSEELFLKSNDQQHIFRKRALKRFDPRNQKMLSDAHRSLKARYRSKPDVGRADENELFHALAGALSPRSVLVTDDFRIIRVNGDMTDLIALTEATTLSMQLSLLKSPYKEESRSLITLALKHGQPRRGIRHRLSEDGVKAVRLEAVPIVAPDADERLALLLFHEDEIIPHASTIPASNGDQDDAQNHAHMLDLETELASTREALQQTIEELETSNEELQSLNEELQSTNEELQATNEEMETSNEELQSTNEELITVNEELQVNTGELTAISTELSSVLDSIPTPLLVVDSALQITRASTSSVELFRLSRPLDAPHLSQCMMPEGFPVLTTICNEALRLGHSISRSFSSGDMAYVVECAPFFDDRGRLSGATMIFVETPELQLLARELEYIINHVPFFLMNRTADGTILRISEKSAQVLGYPAKQATGKNLKDVMESDFARKVAADDKGFLDSGESQMSSIYRIETDGAEGPVWLSNQRWRYFDDARKEETVYSLGFDVSALMDQQAKLAARNQQLELIQTISGIAFWQVDIESGEIFWSDRVYEIHGVQRSSFELNLETAIAAYHPDDRPVVRSAIEKSIAEKTQFKFQLRLCRPDNTEVHVESIGDVIQDEDGTVTSIVGVFRELSKPAKKRAQKT